MPDYTDVEQLAAYRKQVDDMRALPTRAAVAWEGEYPNALTTNGLKWHMRFLPTEIVRLLDRMVAGKRYRVIVEELVEDSAESADLLRFEEL